jgi:ABC-2 type transport system ATP-binding protein
MPAAVSVESLVKRYPKARANAVDGLSFTVEPGEIFGLLGPNGAGKTTTVGVLTTRVRPDSGIARVAGVDVAADPVGARRRLGVVPQRNNLDRSLSVQQNLLFHATYHGVAKAVRTARAHELLEAFGLADRANDKPSMFSGGQAQRVMIARALMHQPEVLFLDEPTTGLDPAARLFVWDRIRELHLRGVTTILTTHGMEEASELCQRVGIVDRGQMLACGTPDDLIRTLPGGRSLVATVALQTASHDAVVAELKMLSLVTRVETIGTPGQTELEVCIYLDGEPAEIVGPAAASLAGIGARLVGVRLGEASLEDVFIHLTGRSLR